MIVVIKKPGEMPAYTSTDGSLHDLQKLIGGYIRVAWFDTGYFKGDGQLTVYCDCDGYLRELPYNVAHPITREAMVGPLLMVKERDKEIVEMTEQEAAFVLKHFTKWAEACAQMQHAVN